jgi:hypothetical protein
MRRALGSIAALALLLGACKPGVSNTGSIKVRSMVKATLSTSRTQIDCPVQVQVDAGLARPVPDGTETEWVGLDEGQHVLLFSSDCTLQEPKLHAWKCLVQVKAGQTPVVVLSAAVFSDGISVRCPE